MSTPMIAMTTSSSIRVKPLRAFDMDTSRKDKEKD